MKIKKLVSYIIAIIVLLHLVSCLIDNEGYIPHYTMKILSFNLDGTELCSYYPGECFVVPMHNNERFISCNEDLYVWDIGTDHYEKYLTDIEIDWDYSGMDKIGVSYDDSLVAFVSDDEIYCLDLSSGDYTQITEDHHDDIPQFGIDDRIYFRRNDIENDNYKLMRMEADGSNIEEVCTTEEIITHIFPGQVDSNLVYFVCEMKIFYKIFLDNQELVILHVFTMVESAIARSIDDRYFSFANYNQAHSLYDNSSDTIQTYLSPSQTTDTVSKVLPNQKKAITKRSDGIARLKLWDIDSDSQIGEDIIIEYTGDFGKSSYCFTPDGQKVIIIHKILWGDY
jgi:hypothetical protein